MRSRNAFAHCRGRVRVLGASCRRPTPAANNTDARSAASSSSNPQSTNACRTADSTRPSLRRTLCQNCIVGHRPDAHRTLERPVVGPHRAPASSPPTGPADRCGEGSRTGPPVVVEVAPRIGQRGAVGPHIGEVPVEAALGDFESLAQAADAQRIRSALGEQREAGLGPSRRPSTGSRCGAPASCGSIRCY